MRSTFSFSFCVTLLGAGLGTASCSSESKSEDGVTALSDSASSGVTKEEDLLAPSPSASTPVTSGSEVVSSQMEESGTKFSQSLLSSAHIEEKKNATTSLNLAAPFALVLGPEALKAVYEPVFGSAPRSGSRDPWFNTPTFGERMNNNPSLSFFSPTEYTDLGGTLLEVVWEPRQNQYRNVDSTVKPRPDLDSQYLVALRSFLGDACRNLLAVEMARTSVHSNLIYSGETLEPSKAAEFMRRLTGLPPGAVSKVDAYVAAFPDLLPRPLPEPANERTAALRVAYQHLCVAMASDVRVITR